MNDVIPSAGRNPDFFRFLTAARRPHEGDQFPRAAKIKEAGETL